MNRRSITRTLGAAAGGLVGVAFLPAAAASADDYTIDPTGTETVTGIYGTGIGHGAYTAPPAVAGSIQGYQIFDYNDTTTGATGTFIGDESTFTDSFDEPVQEVLVTSDATGPDGALAPDAPPVGSVFDTYTFGDGEENIYSAIPSTTGGDTITDTLVTPYGDYAIPVTFDAADGSFADAAGVTIGNGDVIDPTGSQAITAINGLPPLTVAVQGDQLFDVDGTSGNMLGTFDADETTTSDLVGTYTEAVLVTNDVAGADVPPVGSVFNTINFAGIENIYSDLTSATPGGPDTISDTVVTPLGDFTMPVTLDAAAAESPVALDLPDGGDIVADPDSPEVFTGINGLPPLAVDIQGQQEFDLDSGNTVAGMFDADESKTMDLLGDTTQTLLVTNDVSGTDAPPVGSVFETVSFGPGLENVYTDLASTTPGGDVISDTLVTPLGDIPLVTTFDLAAGLALDHFLNLLAP